MVVYFETRKELAKFYNGDQAVAFKYPISEYYRSINICFSEIVAEDVGKVVVVKRY